MCDCVLVTEFSLKQVWRVYLKLGRLLHDKGRDENSYKEKSLVMTFVYFLNKIATTRVVFSTKISICELELQRSLRFFTWYFAFLFGICRLHWIFQLHVCRCWTTNGKCSNFSFVLNDMPQSCDAKCRVFPCSFVRVVYSFPRLSYRRWRRPYSYRLPHVTSCFNCL